MCRLCILKPFSLHENCNDALFPQNWGQTLSPGGITFEVDREPADLVCGRRYRLGALPQNWGRRGVPEAFIPGRERRRQLFRAWSAGGIHSGYGAPGALSRKPPSSCLKILNLSPMSGITRLTAFAPQQFPNAFDLKSPVSADLSPVHRRVEASIKTFEILVSA